jgi:membrane protease YdiL (CAAX protease family)
MDHPDLEQGDAPPSTPARRGRILACLLWVGLWMAAGWTLRLSTDAYLLLGIPLTILFQWFVRREPVRALWVRAAPPLRFDGQALGLALLFAVPLGVSFGGTLSASGWNPSRLSWDTIVWHVAGLGGAVGAAYAVRHFRREDLGPFVSCLLVVGLIGCLLMLPRVFANPPPIGVVPKQAGIGLLSFLVYVPIGFALEEVFFRGALDAYLHRPGVDQPRSGIYLVSILWGLWHLPALPENVLAEAGPAVAIVLIAVHTAVGVPLSLAWRRTGNLLVPAVAHALIDGIRNAVQLG